MIILRSGRDDPHLLPVIGEFPAAVETNNIGASLLRGRNATLSAPGANGEAEAFVPAAE